MVFFNIGKNISKNFFITINMCLCFNKIFITNIVLCLGAYDSIETFIIRIVTFNYFSFLFMCSMIYNVISLSSLEKKRGDIIIYFKGQKQRAFGAITQYFRLFQHVKRICFCSQKYHIGAFLENREMLLQLINLSRIAILFNKRVN